MKSSLRLSPFAVIIFFLIVLFFASVQNLSASHSEDHFPEASIILCGTEGNTCCPPEPSGQVPACSGTDGEGRTLICCTPGSNICLGQCSGGYGYPTPEYGYPTPEYGYPTPGYGYPTPGYTYPTPIVTYTLSTIVNSGSGTISGVGISCPGDCSESYASDTWVTLTATPAAGYEFGNWTGACSGAPTLNPCSIQITANMSVGVTFNAVTPFNYSLSNSGNLTVPKGSGNTYGQNTITKTLLAGTSQSVTLSLSGVPSGVSYSIANGTCSPSCASTITFTVNPTTSVGTYTITVTGAPLGQATSFNLTINAPDSGTIALTCTPNQNVIFLGETAVWTSTISGGVPPYTYSWSGPGIPSNPAPNTRSMSITYTTIGQKYAILTVTDSVGAYGSCVFGEVGSSTFLEVKFTPEFEEF